MPEEFDLYADENEPTVRFVRSTYRVVIDRGYAVNVTVNNDTGDVESVKYFPKIPYFDSEEDVYAYLREWELIELIKVGPDDSEWFATEKLTATGGS